MRKLIIPLLVALCLAVSGQTLAGTDAQTERDIQGVRNTFVELSKAYAAEDVELFLRLHEPLLPSIDGPRDLIAVTAEEATREELVALFAMLDEIRMEF